MRKCRCDFTLFWGQQVPWIPTACGIWILPRAATGSPLRRLKEVTCIPGTGKTSNSRLDFSPRAPVIRRARQTQDVPSSRHTMALRNSGCSGGAGATLLLESQRALVPAPTGLRERHVPRRGLLPWKRRRALPEPGLSRDPGGCCWWPACCGMAADCAAWEPERLCGDLRAEEACSAEVAPGKSAPAGPRWAPPSMSSPRVACGICWESAG